MKKIILLIPIFILLISCGKNPNDKTNTKSNISTNKITEKNVSTNESKKSSNTNIIIPSTNNDDVFEDNHSYGPLH